MKYKLERLDVNNSTSWVVKNADTNEVVSERFENKTQALTIMADFINGKRLVSDTTIQQPKMDVVESEVFPEKLVIVERPPTELTHTAVGMFLDNDGCWKVATFGFNPMTGEVGEMATERAGLNRLEGEDKFRVTAALKVLKS